MKVILNKCYGGFDVSYLGYKRYAEKIGIKEIFAYKFKGKEYVKVNGVANEIFIVYFIKDLGESFSSYELDNYSSFKLVLDENRRQDPILIEVVEELGDEASGLLGNLKVVEVPDELDNNYVIDEYDGFESLHQRVEEY